MTAHCKVSTDIPVSSLIAGRRILTAEVFALTTSVEMQVAASTPPAPTGVLVAFIRGPSRARP